MNDVNDMNIVIVNKEKENSLTTSVAFFDTWDRCIVTWNDEDFRLLENNGEKFLEEFVDTFIKRQLTEKYTFLLDTVFNLKNVSYDNVVTIVPHNFEFQIKTTIGKTIHVSVSYTDLRENKFMNIEIPTEITRGFVKLLKSALEDTGIKITTQITELDWY